jgi:predicted MFS family arabinose efflux permease
MTAAPAAADPDKALRPLLLVLGVGGFASTFTMRLLDPVVPELAREFARSIAEIAIYSTAFAVAYATSQPILGPLADTFGKARVIRFCLLGLAAMLVVSALAASYGQMMVLRAASGAVAGGIIPVSLAAIGDRVPMDRRQVAISRFTVVMILGQILGAAVSGVVSDWFGWRFVFVMAALLAVSAALLSFVVLKPRPGAARASFSIARVVDGYRDVFRNPMSLPLYGLVMIEGGLAFGSFPFLADLFAARSGVGASEAGLAIGFSGVGGLLYGLLASVLIARLGQRRMMIFGGLGMGAALTTLALPLPWWTAPGILLLHGFSFFLIHSSFQTLGTTLSDSARAAAFGLLAGSFFAGHAMGPIVMAAFKASVGVPVGLVAFGAGLACVGILAARCFGAVAPGTASPHSAG